MLTLTPEIMARNQATKPTLYTYHRLDSLGPQPNPPPQICLGPVCVPLDHPNGDIPNKRHRITPASPASYIDHRAWSPSLLGFPNSGKRALGNFTSNLAVSREAGCCCLDYATDIRSRDAHSLGMGLWVEPWTTRLGVLPSVPPHVTSHCL